jgi:hypothetical protein
MLESLPTWLVEMLPIEIVVVAGIIWLWTQVRKMTKPMADMWEDWHGDTRPGSERSGVMQRLATFEASQRKLLDRVNQMIPGDEVRERLIEAFEAIKKIHQRLDTHDTSIDTLRVELAQLQTSVAYIQAQLAPASATNQADHEATQLTLGLVQQLQSALTNHIDACEKGG